MRLCYGTVILWLLLLLTIETNRAETPNVVLFLVDDMGWQDTSVPFHTETTAFNQRYRTPNMEGLANKGVKFTQAYACSVCSPTRISLMTGLNAARHRVTNWTLHKDATNDRNHPTLAFPKWNVNGLSPIKGIERTIHAKALPAFLREAGYRTIHAGKAHLGAIGTPGEDPRNLGFDVNIAGHAAGGPGSFLGTQDFSAVWREGAKVWDVPGLDQYHGKDVFLTEVLTIEALKLMDQSVADEKPFFLYLSHYAVHAPFAEDHRFYQKYRDDGLDHTEAMYAAMVEGMDKSLGDVLDRLKHHGITDKTVVLFMSDNGGLSAVGRGGEKHSHNQPLSSGKGSAHEGGVRVPMIGFWPNVTKPGTVCGQRVMIEDFFPTILEIAGIQDAKQIGGISDGLSFTKLLRNEIDQERDDRPLFWHFPNNWGPQGPGIGPTSSVRQRQWKLIYYYEDRRFELFDLDADLGERSNLADSHPETRDRLAKLLHDYLNEVDAQFPIDKQTGKTIEIPTRTELINFSDARNIAERRPIIIAHRGGVVSADSHECSLTAIRLAATAGYDMVEVDVQASRDGVPMLFHDRTLTKACGRNGSVADYTATELEAISYLTGDDSIIRLETALESCRRLGLGVMLDLKTGQDLPEFLELIDQLLVRHGLGAATISISGSETARLRLTHVRFTATDEEMRRLRTSEVLDLSQRFWFGLPKQLQPGDIGKLNSSGALIIPAINTFRYPEKDHLKHARNDIQQLTEQGVDGFQIDSIYFSSMSDMNRETPLE
ncbi:MAG: arylsulfatase A-like enzyme/glycerophosphoryl diester phosphodiesterase [Verrucomicrobiales bacterium]|jgi:arylsulfatase A-like enzyme/glycerophosphoryl diester phosphodiesterase